MMASHTLQTQDLHQEFRAHRVGWRLLRSHFLIFFVNHVLSPLGGMVTFPPPIPPIPFSFCPKPTGWDGDKSAGLGKTRTGILRLVLSPLCGMATIANFRTVLLGSSSGSKPTVWDDDKVASQSPRSSINRSEPTAWDSNWHSYLCNSGILPSVPNVPLGAESLELKEKGLNF